MITERWCLWCNGSTGDCGSPGTGSNPVRHPKISEKYFCGDVRENKQGGSILVVEIKDKIWKFQAESELLRREIRKRTADYIFAALGFVVGLAWNEAIKGLIEYLFPLTRDTVLAKFIYAGILTLVLVVFTVYIMRWVEVNSQK